MPANSVKKFEGANPKLIELFEKRRREFHFVEMQDNFLCEAEFEEYEKHGHTPEVEEELEKREDLLPIRKDIVKRLNLTNIYLKEALSLPCENIHDANLKFEIAKEWLDGKDAVEMSGDWAEENCLLLLSIRPLLCDQSVKFKNESANHDNCLTSKY